MFYFVISLLSVFSLYMNAGPDLSVNYTLPDHYSAVVCACLCVYVRVHAPQLCKLCFVSPVKAGCGT